MASTIQYLKSRNVGSQPKWLAANMMYETIMGSTAYGVSSDASDMDVYGFCIPPKNMTFPHLAGEIPGFGTQIQRFDQYQEHHLKAPDKNRTFDFSIYSIVKYFNLCMENNPNMIDSLFTAPDCVLFTTTVGDMVRDNRHMFLHKGVWPKFRGYATSQFHKMEIKNPRANPKRQADVDAHGFDTKYAYHLVRLLLECEQLMTKGDMDLRRDRELLKAIRRGEWALDDLKKWHSEKLVHLESVKDKSVLPEEPREAEIKKLLVDCLEHHYGSLSDAVVVEKDIDRAFDQIIDIINEYRK